MIDARFSLAGIEAHVLVRGAATELAGFYDRFPGSGGAPALIIDIEQVPGFAEGRPDPVPHPSFARRRADDGSLELSRADVEGRIAVDGDLTIARFRAGESPGSIEAAIRAGLSIALPRVGALIVHSSAVAARGRAMVFCGVSGAGKSTISDLVASTGRARKIADDLLVIDRDQIAISPPFTGGHGLPHGERFPVDSLHLLAQASEHERTPIGPAEAARQLLRHVVSHVVEPITASHVLAAIECLCARVPCFALAFAPSPDVGGVVGIT